MLLIKSHTTLDTSQHRTFDAVIVSQITVEQKALKHLVFSSIRENVVRNAMTETRNVALEVAYVKLRSMCYNPL